MKQAHSFTVVALGALVASCAQPLKLSRDDSKIVLAQQSLNAPNPADPGPLAVRTFYYGSGTDKQRRIFRDSVMLKTRTVDASAFVSMTPELAKDRENYWGF